MHDRKLTLQFRNGSPGTKYLRSFERRHAATIRFTKPTRQEAFRFRACNGDHLSHRLSVLEIIIAEHSIGPIHIWNCDECGNTPGKDAHGKENSRVYVTRAGARDAKIGHFINATRVTMVPAVSAFGDTAPPLFVFNGRQLPYCHVIDNVRSSVETYADCLPPRSLVCMPGPTNKRSWRMLCDCLPLLPLGREGGGVYTTNLFQ